jgi:hypothetical protein
MRADSIRDPATRPSRIDPQKPVTTRGAFVFRDSHSHARAFRVVFAAAAVASIPCAQNSFTEVAQSIGVVHEHIAGFDQFGLSPLPNSMMRDWCQSGIAVGDLDLDGDPDVVMCGSLTPPAVFRNDGTSFVDVTASAGLESSEFYRVPALGDFDRDGDLDLFTGALDGGQGPTPGKSRLYRNEGGFVFTDVTCLANLT